MNFFLRLKDALVNRAAESIAASMTALIAWSLYKLLPALLPSLLSALSMPILLSLLGTSLLMNFVFLIIVWVNESKREFRLKYGIYWDKDKNPHCPSCKIPLAAFGSYQMGGTGYYCKPCKQVFPLADATGKNIDPTSAMGEL